MNNELLHSHEKNESRLVGAIEKIDHGVVSGWALNTKDLLDNPEVELLIDGRLVSSFRMHLMQPEIEAMFKLPPGTFGPLGFSVRLPKQARLSGSHILSLHCSQTRRIIGRPYTYTHKSPYLVVNREQSWEYGETECLPVNNHPSTRAGRKHNQQASGAKCARPLVSAIILNRDGADCLHALFASWHRYNSVPAELIVIDHASQDKSLEVVRTWSQTLDIRWVGLQYNDSFSASSNRGAKLAKAPYLLFLNNDIVWVQDVLPGMLQTLQQRTQVAVGLKLLRHDGQTSDPVSLANAPIQHLGVRLTLSDHLYWPYECSPENAHSDDELFAVQKVPAVTAAVMLMRARDFKRLGGFDERYFYGYEDVELCLRAVQSDNSRRHISCRNDLVALHRHGHSRLSGRQPDVTRKLSGNQQVFAQKLGLWAKQAWWQSLVQQDRLLCGETLTIGIVYDDCPLDITGEIGRDIAAAQHKAKGIQAFEAQTLIQSWASKLSEAFGQARLLLYPRSAGGSDFSQAHMLWVLAPEWANRSGSQLREAVGLRADCRAVAVIGPENLKRWGSADSSGFCAALAEATANLTEIRTNWLTCPALFHNDHPETLKSIAQPRKRLFIAMHVDGTNRPAKVKARQQIQEQGRVLQLIAEKLGLLVWSERFTPNSKLLMPVAEIVVHIWPSSATGIRRQADDLQDAHHVAWICGGNGQGTTVKALQGFDQCWTTVPCSLDSEKPRRIRHRLVTPDVASVRAALQSALNTVEKRIGRAFSTS